MMIVSCMNFNYPFHLCQRNDDWQQVLLSESSACQTGSKEKLRKGKESSVTNFISDLKLRQDDVYQRLSLWHASCYATYTSIQNIKYCMLQIMNQRYVMETDVEKESTETSPRVSLSNTTPHDCQSVCFVETEPTRKKT